MNIELTVEQLDEIVYKTLNETILMLQEQLDDKSLTDKEDIEWAKKTVDTATQLVRLLYD